MGVVRRFKLNQERTCEYCGKTFAAKTTKTRFCYDEYCEKKRYNESRRRPKEQKEKVA